MDNNLKNLINQNYTGTSTTAGTSTSNTINYTQYGWKCPVCGAVMSPWTSACVNCRGNNNWQYPYTYPTWIDASKVTCEAPQVILKTNV